MKAQAVLLMLLILQGRLIPPLTVQAVQAHGLLTMILSLTLLGTDGSGHRGRPMRTHRHGGSVLRRSTAPMGRLKGHGRSMGLGKVGT